LKRRSLLALLLLLLDRERRALDLLTVFVEELVLHVLKLRLLLLRKALDVCFLVVFDIDSGLLLDLKRVSEPFFAVHESPFLELPFPLLIVDRPILHELVLNRPHIGDVHIRVILDIEVDQGVVGLHGLAEHSRALLIEAALVQIESDEGGVGQQGVCESLDASVVLGVLARLGEVVALEVEVLEGAVDCEGGAELFGRAGLEAVAGDVAVLDGFVAADGLGDDDAGFVGEELAGHVDVFEDRVWEVGVLRVDGSEEHRDLRREQIEAGNRVLGAIDILQRLADHDTEDAFLEGENEGGG
jgi:hypothetical protein